MTELPFKAWLVDRARDLGVKPHSVYYRMRRGKMKWPKLRKVNARLWMVKINN